MRQNKQIQTAKYVLTDYLAAAVAWSLLFVFRKSYIEPLKFGYNIPLELDQNFYYGLVIIPLLWLVVYYLTGTYKHIYRKSRLKEIGQTLLMSLIGVVIIFFTLLLDDEVASYKNYYKLFFTLLFLHFFITATLRFILSSSIAHKIHNRIIGFNTLIIGSNKNALDLLQELESQKKSSGFLFKGYIHINGDSEPLLDKYLPCLGQLADLRKNIKEKEIEEVIIALESSEHDNIQRIVNTLENEKVFVKVLPNMYDIMTGSVRMSSIFGAPLIEINHEIMPEWQQSIKRLFDISVSFVMLIVFSPVYLLIAMGVKLSSKGAILYKQERVGRDGKSFAIYKFRSMYEDAEKDGPALSSQRDSRITPFGRILRKMRLDELPQFYNVLIGEMSIVGPRPERQYFIDQITLLSPHYVHLHKVRPGITSWGQVKYGYAENVEQMIERLKYDIIYIENMSLFVDFKIMIYTILIILKGSGK